VTTNPRQNLTLLENLIKTPIKKDNDKKPLMGLFFSVSRFKLNYSNSENYSQFALEF